nr:hypothetical protein [Candidatus Sigynarchaeum springense]
MKKKQESKVSTSVDERLEELEIKLRAIANVIQRRIQKELEGIA